MFQPRRRHRSNRSLTEAAVDIYDDRTEESRTQDLNDTLWDQSKDDEAIQKSKEGYPESYGGTVKNEDLKAHQFISHSPPDVSANT